LLDRLDIRCELGSMTLSDLGAGGAESSAAVRERVLAARDRMARRYRDLPWSVNGEVPTRELRRRWPLAAAALAPAHAAVDTGRLSARGLDRAVRVAWTLADLEGRDVPGASHVRRALSLRKVTPHDL
jgi:magnesium chelatase family protein